jgi:hypothetical protein
MAECCVKIKDVTGDKHETHSGFTAVFDFDECGC